MVGKHFSKPAEAILDSKKKKDAGKTFGYLVLSALLIALAGAIATARISISMGFGGFGPIFVAAGLFLLVMTGGLVVGWLVQIIATTLGGKGRYYEGLASVSHALLAPSIGAVAAAILSYLPLVGLPLVFLALAITLSIGFATFYRSIKELYSTDMITAFVVVSILSLALILALLGTMVSLPNWLSMSSFRMM